ncbi:MAG: PASTA domain-containing protein, partial [Muribaculaceae bacterium]|nr:PASTA domain-containing protein [Muribaculaceae bacterium]
IHNRRPEPDEDFYDDRRRHTDRNYRNNTPEMNRPEGFRKRHPVLMNLLYIILTGMLLIWMLLWFLDFWTFHGEERVVPDVKGQTYESAAGNVDISGLNAIISDSVFDSYSRPGTVIEQTPIPGARIKKGGNVYLTIVAFSPKLVTVPDFYNVSARQARSMFEGIGIKEIREVPVTSEFAGLVLGAKFNGVSLQPGARIPVSAIVTIEVGSGWGDATETDTYTDTDAVADPQAIDEVIEELNIE